MSQFGFSVGSMWVAATMDASGNTIAVPTPIKFGELQDVTPEFGRDTKLLHGALAFPVAVGGGKQTAKLKAKFARISGRLLNDLYFGQARTGGTLYGVLDGTTSATIPTTPFTITVAPPSTGTYARDLGVVGADGRPYDKVASAPATGQYSVSVAGVYTFAAADVGKAVFISYTYSATTGQATAQSIAINNLPMGTIPTFGVDTTIQFSGDQLNMRFPNCVCGKLAFSPKQDDFTTIDVEIDIFADSAGVIGQLITTE